ncbi:MAG: hypothetical protein IKY98_04185, partial [Alphaproteobacteria bacterium]|nr:hypothetical protein [Alphaproteobacteria bacterium]
MKKVILFLVCFFIGWFGYRFYHPIFFVKSDMKPLEFWVEGPSSFLPEIKINGEQTFVSNRGIEALTMNTLYPNTIQIGDTVQKVRIAAFEENQYIPITVRFSDKAMSFNIY